VSREVEAENVAENESEARYGNGEDIFPEYVDDVGENSQEPPQVDDGMSMEPEEMDSNACPF
jgi:hypothetical protein